MKFLGLDPGLATIGYAIIEEVVDSVRPLDYGCLTTPAGMPFVDRLKMIKDDLSELLLRYRPASAAVETILFETNKKTAMDVAQARGVIMLSLREHDVPIVELSPLQVKNMATGDGRADKIQIQTMVQKIFSLKAPPKPDDAADALALSWCAYLRNGRIG